MTTQSVSWRTDTAVVSVGGRKQYQMKEGFWDGYGAEMDRHAEDTQLFQVIRVDGDRMSCEASTATGELYDAFELVKQEGRPNRLPPPPGRPLQGP